VREIVPLPAPDGPSIAMMSLCIGLGTGQCNILKSMRSRRWIALAATVMVVLAIVYVGTPYVRAASLIVRAANLGGRVEAFANDRARSVTITTPHTVPTRLGDVPARFYQPSGSVRRTVLLVPGIHSMGIEEPRLKALADDLAGTGVRVMTMALPDLQQYRVTPRSVDVIEDTVAWMAQRPDLAPDGRVGIVGISFAGGLSIVAAGRSSIRDKVAYIVSFGGHGDLPRVLTYLCTGEAPQVEGLVTHPPHDYGVAVITYGLADYLVPADQAEALKEGVRTFLLASQLTLVDMNQANATFQKARDMAKAMPEPAATYLTYVNDRNVAKLGPALVPHLSHLGADSPAGSPQRAPSLPSAPVYLLHGDGDTVIPAAESAILGEYLREKGVDVHVLLSGLITHAEVDRTAAAAETWKLVAFWASVLRQ
jgi:dienelactone hydrolase